MSHVTLGVQQTHSSSASLAVLGVVVEVGHKEVVPQAALVVRVGSLKLALMGDHPLDLLKKLGVPPCCLVALESVSTVLVDGDNVWVS